MIHHSDVFVGRQPIFDRKGNVYGYELLFRSDTRLNRAVFDSPSEATATVIHNSLMNMGLQHLVGSYRAFINFPEAFFKDVIEPCFSNDQIVIEVLEDIPVTEEVLQSMKRFKQAGFLLALDDFVYRKRAIPFIKLADIVKFDVIQLNPANLKPLFEKVRNVSPARILAEKVETQGMFEACANAGADLFQGYFFAEPEIITGKAMTVERQNFMSLMAKISQPTVDLNELQVIIERDVGLSHKIMKMAQHYRTVGVPEFSSMREILMLFGVNRVRSWITLLTLCDIDDVHSEVFNLARIRAIFMRKFAVLRNLPNADSFYLAGLFSLLDTILHESLDEAIGKLPISPEIREGLIKRKGVYGEVLDKACRFENGIETALNSSDKEEDADFIEQSRLYLEAVEESTALSSIIHTL